MALGVSYHGQGFSGWQSQPSGNTVQDHLEAALGRFALWLHPCHIVRRPHRCRRTASLVVHLDAPAQRTPFSWCEARMRFAVGHYVQWAHPCLLNSMPALTAALRPRAAARAPKRGSRARRLGLSSAWRATRQLTPEGRARHIVSRQRLPNKTPIKHCTASISTGVACPPARPRPGKTPLATGALSSRATRSCHMVRNIMGCLIAVGKAEPPPGWPRCWLRAHAAAAPTFSPDGLYFLGPVYDPRWGLPTRTPAYDWLP